MDKFTKYAIYFLVGILAFYLLFNNGSVEGFFVDDVDKYALTILGVEAVAAVEPVAGAATTGTGTTGTGTTGTTGTPAVPDIKVNLTKSEDPLPSIIQGVADNAKYKLCKDLLDYLNTMGVDESDAATSAAPDLEEHFSIFYKGTDDQFNYVMLNYIQGEDDADNKIMIKAPIPVDTDTGETTEPCQPTAAATAAQGTAAGVDCAAQKTAAHCNDMELSGTNMCIFDDGSSGVSHPAPEAEDVSLPLPDGVYILKYNKVLEIPDETGDPITAQTEAAAIPENIEIYFRPLGTTMGHFEFKQYVTPTQPSVISNYFSQTTKATLKVFQDTCSNTHFDRTTCPGNKPYHPTGICQTKPCTDEECCLEDPTVASYREQMLREEQEILDALNALGTGNGTSTGTGNGNGNGNGNAGATKCDSYNCSGTFITAKEHGSTINCSGTCDDDTCCDDDSTTWGIGIGSMIFLIVLLLVGAVYVFSSRSRHKQGHKIYRKIHEAN
jgi:hypothetical protein